MKLFLITSFNYFFIFFFFSVSKHFSFIFILIEEFLIIHYSTIFHVSVGHHKNEKLDLKSMVRIDSTDRKT